MLTADQPRIPARYISKPSSKTAKAGPVARTAAFRETMKVAWNWHFKGARFAREDGQGNWQFAKVTAVKPKTYLLHLVESTIPEEPSLKKVFPSKVPIAVDWDKLWVCPFERNELIEDLCAHPDGTGKTSFRAKHSMDMDDATLVSGSGYRRKLWFVVKPGQTFHQRFWFSES